MPRNCRQWNIKAFSRHFDANQGIPTLNGLKARGILTLAKALQHTEDAIMVVGNGESDLDMLAYFKHSVAVHDAQIQRVALDSLSIF